LLTALAIEEDVDDRTKIRGALREIVRSGEVIELANGLGQKQHRSGKKIKLGKSQW